MKDYYKHVEDVLKKFIKHYLYTKSLKYMIKKLILKFCEHVVKKKKM